MKNIEPIPSVQDWLPIDKILEKGIVQLKDTSLVKILCINPINYNLKSDLEKEAILNSYKKLFKSCNFDLQVLIQSKKEDLSNNIKILMQNNKHEKIKKNYIQYITELNKTKKSSSKNFYLIIKESSSEKSINIKIKNLHNNYIKVKDLLSRCGNIVSECTNEKNLTKIIFSLLNSKNF